MKFIYIGDPRDKDDQTKGGTVDGVYFAKGEATEVPEKVSAKLLKHSHFKVSEEKAGQPKPSAKKKSVKKKAPQKLSEAVKKPKEAE